MSRHLRLRARSLALPIALLVVGAVGCGGAQSGQSPGRIEDPGGAPNLRCVAPTGVSASPESVEQALALINALPKPTSLACFLQSLDRPLRLYATSGVISAQPAQGQRSPRIFLFSPSGSFLMSMVPAGPGTPLLEFGEEIANARSVKAELAFPVNEPVSADLPFTRVKTSDHSTTCGLCHPDERPVSTDTTSQRFSSLALRPVPSERVSLSELRAEWQSCDAATEPDRCAMLDALFSYGDTTDAEFPPDLATIVP